MISQYQPYWHFELNNSLFCVYVCACVCWGCVWFSCTLWECLTASLTPIHWMPEQTLSQSWQSIMPTDISKWSEGQNCPQLRKNHCSEIWWHAYTTIPTVQWKTKHVFICYFTPDCITSMGYFHKYLGLTLKQEIIIWRGD